MGNTIMQVIHPVKYWEDTKIRSKMINETSGTDRITVTKGPIKDDRMWDFFAAKARPTPRTMPAKVPKPILIRDAPIVCQNTGLKMSRLIRFKTSQGELIKIFSDHRIDANCQSKNQNKRPAIQVNLPFRMPFRIRFCFLSLVIEIISRQGPANRLGVGFM